MASSSFFYSTPHRYPNRASTMEDSIYERFLGDFEGEGGGSGAEVETEFERLPSHHRVNESVYDFDFDMSEPMYDLSVPTTSRARDVELDMSPRNRFVSSPPNLVDYPTLLRSPNQLRSSSRRVSPIEHGLRTPRDVEFELGLGGLRGRDPRVLVEEEMPFAFENENNGEQPRYGYEHNRRRQRPSVSTAHPYHSVQATPRRYSASIQSSPSLSSADSYASSLPRTPPPPTSLTLQQQQRQHIRPRNDKEQILYEEFLMLKGNGVLLENESFENWLAYIRGADGGSRTGEEDLKSLEGERLLSGEMWDERRRMRIA